METIVAYTFNVNINNIKTNSNAIECAKNSKIYNEQFTERKKF